MIICVLSIIPLEQAEEDIVIVIDPGHGGLDSGATVGSIKESDLVLDISYKISEVFNNFGYKVILTRTSKNALCEGKFIKKIDTQKRIDIINENNASLVISVHLNKFNLKEYYGAQVFFSNVNNKSSILAIELQNSLNKYTNTNRKIKEINNIYLLNKINVASCIVECGFMSNDNELKLLQDEGYQYILAYSLMYGVDRYFNK